jgi:hypothetical protein
MSRIGSNSALPEPVIFIKRAKSKGTPRVRDTGSVTLTDFFTWRATSGELTDRNKDLLEQLKTKAATLSADRLEGVISGVEAKWLGEKEHMSGNPKALRRHALGNARARRVYRSLLQQALKAER